MTFWLLKIIDKYLGLKKLDPVSVTHTITDLPPDLPKTDGPDNMLIMMQGKSHGAISEEYKEKVLFSWHDEDEHYRRVLLNIVRDDARLRDPDVDMHEKVDEAIWMSWKLQNGTISVGVHEARTIVYHIGPNNYCVTLYDKSHTIDSPKSVVEILCQWIIEPT